MVNLTLVTENSTKSFQGTQSTRSWFGTASINLPRADYASLTRMSCLMRWLAARLKKDSWLLCTFSLARTLMLF